MKRALKTLVLLVVLAGAAYAAFRYYKRETKPPATSFQTVAVERGNLVATIDATGPFVPLDLIDVGAQVAGRIVSFGTDRNGRKIDNNSEVDENMVLAQIDDSVYASDLAFAQAQLGQAQAGLERAHADLGQYEAKLAQAQSDWKRAQELGPSKALSATSYDAYKADYDVAQANVEVGKAEIAQAKASVAQAQASVEKAQRYLSYCTIRSPVKGVIITRRVNVGQTVVSSLNAPSLFLIAKDLRQLQILVAVNEADIGKIRPGQTADFTVDAFGGQRFHGVVGKVRLNGVMTQNVVTYTVEVNTNNPEGKLLPYMTANVSFEVNRRENVLTVSNAALRWMPEPAQIAPAYRAAAAQGNGAGSPASSGHAGQASDGGPAAPAMRHATLWVVDGAYVKPVPVMAGLTDGMRTEVSGKEVAEGLQVVTGVREGAAQAPPASNGGGASPFTPQFHRTRRGS